MKEIDDLLDGRVARVPFRGCAVDLEAETCLSDRADGEPTSFENVLFPGSFSPWHEGHRQISETATEQLNAPVSYELSVVNVDKPPLAKEQILRCLGQFPGLIRIWLTRAPTFVEKSKLFPAATFLVGVDTIQRIADPRYYQDASEAVEQAIEQIAANRCRFVVFGRVLDGEFCVLSNLTIPSALRELCDEIPPDLFRVDISSTAIREGNC